MYKKQRLGKPNGVQITQEESNVLQQAARNANQSTETPQSAIDESTHAASGQPFTDAESIESTTESDADVIDRCAFSSPWFEMNALY